MGLCFQLLVPAAVYPTTAAEEDHEIPFCYLV
jgi:hypothetical protein